MPRKSGHHTEGVGAFKDHRNGRYFAAYCDDNGWSPDDAERLAVFARWGDACLWVENEAVKQRKAHARRKAWGRTCGQGTTGGGAPSGALGALERRLLHQVVRNAPGDSLNRIEELET